MFLQMNDSGLPFTQRIVYDYVLSKRRDVVSSCSAYISSSVDNVHLALAAVDQGETIRSAALRFGVARSTLHDRITGKVQEGAKRGPPTYLTLEEEEELASFLLRCADIGYAHSLPQVLALVQNIAESKGIDKTVTRGWWQKFCQRHKQVTHRMAVPLSIARVVASDRNVMNRYFDMLTDTLESNGLLHKPELIYNCDETGMPLGALNRKVVARVGSSNPSCITTNSKTQVTVLACVSAAGLTLPPFVIFQRKTMNYDLTKGEVPGTLYGLSDKGWITQKLFLHWFHNHFLTYIPAKKRPVLLLMDGHSSHYCPAMIRMAANEKVILFTLPPHTTHLSQPLDRSCFGPLKTSWRQVCQTYCYKNPGRVVGIYEFSHLFAEAWYNSMTIKNITSGFKVTGVFPVDRFAIKLPEDTKPVFKPEALAVQSGLAYIPLYSPAYSKSPSSTMESCADDSSLVSVNTGNDSSHMERSFSEDNLSIGYFNDSYCKVSLRKSSLGGLMTTPVVPSKLPAKRVKSCRQVLTSAEFLQKMEEAEEIKRAKAREKEEKRLQRMEKAKRKQKDAKKSLIPGNHL